ncbi:unnamed protein product [Blepharisma stoltei]|uniref:Uncharacterized protein n=1 Tax=Blepharisma stoltei TaxID=1481888 RepID=A0AAU9J0A6_9CILI|nr:unnamed protein product [Blepharisma stoltei]
MGEKPVIGYLSLTLNSLIAKYKETATQVIMTIDNAAASMISSPNKFKLANSPLDLSEEINQMSHKNNYEVQLSQHKLKLMKQAKEELETKLKFVDQEYKSLTSIPFRSKSIRSFIKQVDDAERVNFIKRMQKEREKSTKSREEFVKSMEEKLFNQMRLDKIAEEELQKSFIDKRQQRLDRIREKVENQRKQRQELLEIGDKELKRVYEAKPMYKQMEENFLNQSIFPEIDKHKEMMEKRRRNWLSIDYEALQSHERNYLRQKKEQEGRRELKVRHKLNEFSLQEASINYYRSEAFEKAKIEEKEKQINELEKIKMRKELAKRSRMYGDLAIELFKPSISIAKQNEILLLQKKHNNRRLHKSLDESHFKRINLDSKESSYSNSEINDSLSISDENKGKAKNLLRHSRTKSMSNRSISKGISSPNSTNMKKAEEKSPPIDKSVDYLNERRKVREKISKILGPEKIAQIEWKPIISNKNILKPEKISLIREIANKAEEKAKSYENLFVGIDSSNLNKIEMNEKVNEVYIGAIKAKLAILNSL